MEKSIQGETPDLTVDKRVIFLLLYRLPLHLQMNKSELYMKI
jgi:hypothetical protein